MSESNKDKPINKDNKQLSEEEPIKENTDQSIEEKLKSSEEKLLRALANSEN